MFFVGNLKDHQYTEKKNHLNPTTISLLKATFPDFKSVSGWAHRHFWIRYVRKCPQSQHCYFKISVHQCFACLKEQLDCKLPVVLMFKGTKKTSKVAEP